MATTLSRVTTFMPAEPILSSEVNAEFNQIVNLLNGTTTNQKARLRVSDAGDPTLELDQLSTGPIAEFYQGGVLKAQIDNDGSFRTSDQFISTVTTGTAPLIVSSTTAVSNLNADLLDGLHAASFLRLDNSELQTLTGPLEVSLASTPFLRFTRTAETARTVDLGVDDSDNIGFFISGGSNPLLIALATGVATFSAIPVGPASNPSTDNQLTRKAYVDSRRTAWSVGWFIADPSTYALNTPSQKIVVPSSGAFTATNVVRHYSAGSASGSFTVLVKKHPFNNTGTVTTLATVTVNPGAVGGSVNVDISPDAALTAGDHLYIELSARSSPLQRDVNIVLEGTQTLF